MLGGGTFTSQNKILNGAYINFISASKASSSLSDRGVAAMALNLDWGCDNEIFEVLPADFRKHSLKIFGYSYDDPKMAGLRDLFQNIKKLYAYKLTSGGVKANNTYCTAKYCGIRGNDIKTVITANADMPERFDVKTYIGTYLVDEQLNAVNTSDLKPNDYVDWKAGVELNLTPGLSLSSGTNGEVNGGAHTAFLNKLESYSFNTLGLVSTDDATKNLYAAFTKRMRDQNGMKFQCVLYDKAADYEGIINVKSDTVGSLSPADLVYWVTGAEAGCAVNKTLLNSKYTGEFVVNTNHTQADLEVAMQKGEFMFHNVNGEPRVLADINSFITETSEKSAEIFGENQSVRVMDQIANDIAVIFNNKYLGKIPNDGAGRVSLWNDIVKHHNQLQDIRAIEGFVPDDVIIRQGEKKNSVVVSDAVTIINAMAKLYMIVTVA